ncbi:uncharacterized protein LOC110831979 [Zootermopsis nevadensis]|uniref:WAP domain-containing protein n=1 Tax=Zootermopsis nevadensis TaxID=136037 RepID=A0A067R2H3_ZOONE|nr:uncharacterized protein LOC110831979 [Zootermopsis nevadensis]KDR17121.1 hypothetical protein L798_08378 [Zootermopsis nevadensis]
MCYIDIMKTTLNFRIVLILLLTVSTNSQSTATSVSGTGPCRLWCQLPCLYPWQPMQYYCCDNYVKTGRCPLIRPICPVASGAAVPGSNNQSPPVCESDRQCAGTDKCCYDQCLLYYTCKPAE